MAENELNIKEGPRPTIDLIVKKISDLGYTFENLVKILLLEHTEYHDEHEDLSNLNDALYEDIRCFINNYSPQEEEELLQHQEPTPQLQEEEILKPIETLIQDLLNVPLNLPEIQEDFNFYFLENDFIEDEFITSIINYVF